MGLFKTALLGAAVYGAYKLATKKDENGKSMVDNVKAKAPEWKGKITRIKESIAREFQTNEL
ncbi:hypothetical protein GCM10023231_40900 [Olivibacter ginsenosidimutans]|uniref:YtxH domain-containing protein n=1 Tax=Olivibacter ginsenosidimutans TaxID=1176537 RepID=A0ABP9CAN0_9SPHI